MLTAATQAVHSTSFSGHTGAYVSLSARLSLYRWDTRWIYSSIHVRRFLVSVLPMRFMPDPVLRHKASRVTSVTADIRKLAEDMVETMHTNVGVGLAAPQVGVARRVIVIQLPDDEEPRVYVNPEITQRDGERQVEEGCLSIPGYRGMVNRSERVRAKALDKNGRLVRIKADQLLAQALEHEIDHLDGILYIDRLVDRNSLWKIDEAPQQEAEEEEPAYAG